MYKSYTIICTDYGLKFIDSRSYVKRKLVTMKKLLKLDSLVTIDLT